MKSSKDIGDIGEKIASQYLKKKRFKIIKRNHHEGKNELDIVAKNKEFIVFAEVKTRCVEDASKIAFEVCAASSVDRDKQTRTVAAAKAYLSKSSERLQPRFDVIEVYLLKSDPRHLIEINHIENAFC